MRLLIFGHSFVRDFSRRNIFQFNLGDIVVQIKYSYYPGVTYRKILDNPKLITDALLSYDPDFLICIVGGNSINNNISCAELCRECRQFYELIRSLSSSLIIIPAQVELRFYKFGNKFDSPTLETYRKKRNSLNRFINKSKIKNHILMVGGPSRLDHKVFYESDGVHLNSIGVEKYLTYIKKTIEYVLSGQ